MNIHIWWAWALKNLAFLLRTERTMKMETKINTVTCPVCGKIHEIKHPLLNIICDCGAKYYGRCEIWLDRKTGNHYAK